MTVTETTIGRVERLLAEGYSPRQIAADLGLTREQVEEIGRAAGARQRERAPAPPAAAPEPQSQPAAPSDIGLLLHHAERSKSKRVQTLAARIREQLATLRGRLADELEAERERQRAEQEQARAKAEVARLERELAAARAKLGKRPSGGPKTDDGNSREIRQWAAANGVDCPTHGRIPRRVRDAYDAAQQAGAA